MDGYFLVGYTLVPLAYKRNVMCDVGGGTKVVHMNNGGIFDPDSQTE